MDLSHLISSTNIVTLIPWVIFFPLLGILVNLIAGKRLGEKFSGTIGSLASGLSFVVSAVAGDFIEHEPRCVSPGIGKMAVDRQPGYRLGLATGHPFGHHDAGRLGCGHVDPYLLDRLHEP